MRIIILSAILILFAGNLLAQKSFEGKIIFAMSNSKDTTQKKFINIYVQGKKVLFVEPSFKKNTPGSKILYDFDKGLGYKLNEQDSTALYMPLTSIVFKEVKDSLSPGATVNIAGYNCKKRIFVNPPQVIPFIDKIECWFPENFYFETDDNKNQIAPPIMFFLNNNISFRTDIYLNKQTVGAIGNAHGQVTYIKEEAVDPSMLTIPKFMRILSTTEYLEEQMGKFKEADDNLQRHGS